MWHHKASPIVDVNLSLRVTILSIMLFACGCHGSVAHDKPEPTAAFRAPTATEAFDLQSKCVKLGKQILDDNVIGSALTQEQISHYNPADNRSYVRLTVHTADLTTSRDKYETDNFLFDGQTADMLASTNYKGGQGYGQIFDDSISKAVKDSLTPSAEEVGGIMDQFLGTDRQLSRH